MKKWMTLVFASLLALALSMPAWSQSTTGKKNQSTTAEKKTEDAKKDEKNKKKKGSKKGAKKDDKDAKKDSKK